MSTYKNKNTGSARVSSDKKHSRGPAISRRNLFTVLGLAATAGFPAKWTRPVVDAVLLPAHSATSGCIASPGCYLTDIGDSFLWPGGGPGPLTVPLFYDPSACPTGTPNTTIDIVIASSSAEASNLFGGGPVQELILEVGPSLPSGCMLYTRPIPG